MRIQAFGRSLSLFEGIVDGIKTRAKAWTTNPGLDLMQDPARDFRRMRNLRNIYLQGAYIAEAVDLYPLYAIGNGYELESDDDAAKEKVEEFLTKINFFDVMWQLMIDAETVRDGIAEILYGNGQLSTTPVNIIVRPAECFNFDTDVKGVITSYTQMYDNRGNNIQKIQLKPEEILHYQYLSRSDSPYGISIIERVVHDIKRDTKVIEATAAGIILHGTPKWHIQANSRKADAIPLSDKEWKALEDEFKEFNAKDQFITEGDVLVEPKDTAGVPNVQLYSDVTLSRVVSGMGVPGELLGLRQGTTDATAVSRIGAFFKKIKSCQRDIEQLWNTRIIDKITGQPGQVKIKLNECDPTDILKDAEFVKIIASLNPQDNFAVMSRKQMQTRLNIDPDEWLKDEGEATAQEPVQPPTTPPDQTGLQNWLNKQNPNPNNTPLPGGP